MCSERDYGAKPSTGLPGHGVISVQGVTTPLSGTQKVLVQAGMAKIIEETSLKW